MTSDDAQPIDPTEVEAKIREFEALELRDPAEFREALATNIMEPDPVETLAFRSETLAWKALASARELIEQAQSFQARDRKGSRTRRGRDAFIQKVGRERRILQMRVDGFRAEKGILPNTPNPRRRAEKRLWSEAMKGEAIPAGRWREILTEEIEKDKQRKRDQKKARQAARRAARS